MVTEDGNHFSYVIGTNTITTKLSMNKNWQFCLVVVEFVSILDKLWFFGLFVAYNVGVADIDAQ